MCLNPCCPCNCVTDGSACACRMTSIDMKMEEAQTSNKINTQGQTSSRHEHNQSISSSGQERNWGWMVSGIICVNILILGCTLVSANAQSNVNISTSDLQAFFILLLLLTSSWMIYYIIYTVRKENAVVYKDGHAGPIWLRGKEMFYFYLGYYYY